MSAKLRGEVNMHTEAMRAATVPCAFCGTLNRVDLERVDDRPRCGSCSKPILLDRPIRVSDADLERVVAGSAVPVLVDFYADWCGPCKIVAPILDELARERRGHLLVTKLDTDRSPTMAVRFAIQGIPTMIVFVDGREAARQVGAAGRRQIEDLVRQAVDRTAGKET
jgi:thioredoxin 2